MTKTRKDGLTLRRKKSDNPVMRTALNKRRGFMNSLTAQIHEEIVMNDQLFASAAAEAKKAEARPAGDAIHRLYSMRTGRHPEGVDWSGVAKSLAKAA